MKRLRTIVLSLVAFVACSKSGPGATTTTPVRDPIPMTESSDTQAPVSARAVLESYEHVRAALAADDMSSVPDSARQLETAARAASSDSHHFIAIADGATRLVAAEDLKAARGAFAEVSQHLVALLASDKALAQGQHVFECPMVSGYNKWVQPSENLENPYMGKRMLMCGGQSSWE